MPETSRNQLTIAAGNTASDQLSTEFIQKKIRAGQELTTLQQGRLNRLGFRHTFQQYRDEYFAAHALHKHGLDAKVEIVKRKIDAEKDALVLKIREDYVNV